MELHGMDIALHGWTSSFIMSENDVSTTWPFDRYKRDQGRLDRLFQSTPISSTILSPSSGKIPVFVNSFAFAVFQSLFFYQFTLPLQNQWLYSAHGGPPYLQNLHTHLEFEFRVYMDQRGSHSLVTA